MASRYDILKSQVEGTPIEHPAKEACTHPLDQRAKDSEGNTYCRSQETSECPNGGDHVWGTDGHHSNVFCKKCFVDQSSDTQKKLLNDLLDSL